MCAAVVVAVALVVAAADKQTSTSLAPNLGANKVSLGHPCQWGECPTQGEIHWQLGLREGYRCKEKGRGRDERNKTGKRKENERGNGEREERCLGFRV